MKCAVCIVLESSYSPRDAYSVVNGFAVCVRHLARPLDDDWRTQVEFFAGNCTP